MSSDRTTENDLSRTIFVGAVTGVVSFLTGLFDSTVTSFGTNSLRSWFNEMESDGALFVMDAVLEVASNRDFKFVSSMNRNTLAIFIVIVV